MAANPFPLLLLAGGALLLAKGKGGSGSAKPESDKPESASPDEGTAETKGGAPLLVLGLNCQAVTPPEADRPAFQAAVAEYISTRAPELYAQFMAGNPPRQRLNANLTPEQVAEAKAIEPGIDVKLSHFTFPADGVEDLWYSIYLELVPPECSRQSVWDDEQKMFKPAVFPSVAASCVAALIRIETVRVLKAVGAEGLDYSPELLTELLQACTGMDPALGGLGK